MYSIKICHLYPDLLNLSGDRGNLITLEKRMEWRGIEVEIVNIAEFLNKMGAKVSGAGSGYIKIVGVTSLKSLSYNEIDEALGIITDVLE